MHGEWKRKLGDGEFFGGIARRLRVDSDWSVERRFRRSAPGDPDDSGGKGNASGVVFDTGTVFSGGARSDVCGGRNGDEWIGGNVLFGDDDDLQCFEQDGVVSEERSVYAEH